MRSDRVVTEDDVKAALAPFTSAPFVLDQRHGFGNPCRIVRLATIQLQQAKSFEARTCQAMPPSEGFHIPIMCNKDGLVRFSRDANEIICSALADTTLAEIDNMVPGGLERLTCR